jgi:hypothetical protein
MEHDVEGPDITQAVRIGEIAGDHRKRGIGDLAGARSADDIMSGLMEQARRGEANVTASGDKDPARIGRHGNTH